jgi:hypothetical protein
MHIMAEVAENAGVAARAFAELIDGVAREPDRAFEDLRSLLFDASRALLRAKDAPTASEVIEGFAAHRFYPLLHHYQLSNWILYARAYARAAGENGAQTGQEARVDEIDRALRAAPSAVRWLAEQWLRD